jgi:opacity protein-like surface antigen
MCGAPIPKIEHLPAPACGANVTFDLLAAGGTMRSNIGILTAMTIGLVVSALAAAARAGDVYLSLRGGIALLDDSDMTIEIPGAGQLPATLEYDPGWLLGIAAGYGWDNGFAVEGEFAYRQNGIDQEQLFGMTIPIDGFERSYALMANGYYRVNTGTMVTPYIGAGVGGALLSIDAESVGGNFSDTDFQFAYQAMAGLALEITPQLDAGLEYRYFATTTPSFSDVTGGNPVTVNPDYNTHNILLTLTYQFQ